MINLYFIFSNFRFHATQLNLPKELILSNTTSPFHIVSVGYLSVLIWMYNLHSPPTLPVELKSCFNRPSRTRLFKKWYWHIKELNHFKTWNSQEKKKMLSSTKDTISLTHTFLLLIVRNTFGKVRYTQQSYPQEEIIPDFSWKRWWNWKISIWD